MVRAKIRLEGVVQGVGFRPFVHRLSREHGLNGFIVNTSSGVDIEVEGARARIDRFYRGLAERLPPLARITSRSIQFCSPVGFKDFSIRESRRSGEKTALVSPDIGTCDTCLRELSDPDDRRYRYPFINCTDCGPRFSIIEGLPYDRPLTTMKKFRMCPRCRKEYEDIRSRRYHAQPNACPVCGPRVTLLKGARRIAQEDGAVRKAVSLLAQGAIVAVKGIGGFHIACDALNDAAVGKLRARKHRPSKPFAVMAPDAEAVRRFCRLSILEEQLLLGPERPIVLLRKKDNPALSRLSPDNNYLGVMAPYAPLHHLLFPAGGSRLLVMTSANEADEPVETQEAEALRRLDGICDYFLVNDRPIANRCDDSIVQVMDGTAVVLRRGRGYSPFPFLLEREMKKPVLACGAELKSTFCLCKGRSAFLSQYIGDLKTQGTYSFYKEAEEKLSRLFCVSPRLIACDLHPDYLSTRYAQERKRRTPSLKLIGVQHHEAHAASVIAEHRISGNVIGVCFDGIGYGTDGSIWGGEFFTGNTGGFERAAALEDMPMPGGDKATAEPYRMAASYLLSAFGPGIAKWPRGFVRKHRDTIVPLIQVCRHGPARTSSCGRLFDAVSSLLGICDIITYEAQAAVRLQMAAERSSSSCAYPFSIIKARPMRINAAEMIRALAADLSRGTDVPVCARKFHNGLAGVTARVCAAIRTRTGINTVCLSGGVFQNRLFLETTLSMLRKKKFEVHYNQLVPTNDGAVALGQAVIANARSK
ncbi:MAG: carbamoyltransferase HypF [Deltaproteobacteria bacterium]